jgi:hypothetical protein
VEVICPTGQAKYFFKEGWTAIRPVCPSGKSVLAMLLFEHALFAKNRRLLASIAERAFHAAFSV